MTIVRKSDVSTPGSSFRTGVQRRRDRRAIAQTSIPLRNKSASSSLDVIQQHQKEALSAKRQRRSSTRQLTNNSVVNKSTAPTQQPASQIPLMPSTGTTPLWLMRLFTIHRHSSIITFVLVAVTLLVYGWTVYSQQLWSQSFRRMQTLQRDERKLMTNNEVLKNKMAQDAERPEAGLVSPSPQSMIFANPSAISPNPVPSTPMPNSEVPQQTVNPVAY
ncbi:hypothetical protein [Iningainema tapete]|uniref:Cell division protein FtsL n=1 Tax=Iningainema tapete BLCC-T55 TaxID=2748662 RepID=A0A8J6XK63_9CYAN|nr:hypothetical protein [Iningainema tapete]MBD2774417.1 hypothetical protein [Iningainema tapete BLCC-T55]